MGPDTPTGRNVVPSPRRNGDSPSSRGSRKPVDAWCDDGSVSRAEPPWLRDRRIQLQGRETRLPRPSRSSPSKTNPFDSGSSSGSLSVNMYKNPYATPIAPITPMAPTTSSQAYTNPFDDSTADTEEKPKSDYTNPFNSPPRAPSSVRNSPRRKITTNPFDNSSSVEESSIDPIRSKKDDSVTMDSLDQFLDTTDETVEESFEEEPNHRPQQQKQQQQEQNRGTTPNSIADSSSMDTNTTSPSVKAQKAAESLKRSFNRPSPRASPRTPSSSARSTPNAAPNATRSSSVRFAPTPSIREESPSPPLRQHPVVTPPSKDTTPIKQNRRSPQELPSLKDFAQASSSAFSPARASYLEPMVPIQRQPSQPVDLDASLGSSTTGTGGKRPQHPLPAHAEPLEIPPLLATKSSTSMEEEASSSSTLSNDDEANHHENPEQSSRLALHDLCDEARYPDDLAWHNALYLLSVRPELCKEQEPECEMNPLHVCCLSTAPIWMTRALLYTRSKQCQEEDVGGRLPLHLCAATSADLDTMQLLVQEHPESVAYRDKRGFTPLHLLLKNDQITLTVEHLRIMLGQTAVKKKNEKVFSQRIRFRKGEHLDASLQALEALKHKQEEEHELMFAAYPEDVQRSLKMITQWKRRQIKKGNMERQTKDSMAYDYIQPASIPTPSGKLLPLHLLVRRKPNPVPTTIMHARLLPGSTLDLCRVLIHAYPQALITRDAGGRTPLLTAMLQTDSLPSEEVVETLLGLRTPQPLDISPAKFAADDTQQLPLHVAAEEMTSNYELLATICEAYPEGIEKQDMFGRTPLHLALANYRATPVDESMLELLNNRRVAKTRDFDGNRPMEWILEHPLCLVQRDESLVFQQFLDDSIDPPKNWRDSDDLVRQLQSLPPWLRRQACGAKYVQSTLQEQLTTPLNTFLVLLWGGVLVALLTFIRLLLEEQKPGHAMTVYILASYLLGQQVIRCMSAAIREETYRLLLSNPWTYIHWASGVLSITVAHTIDSEAAAFEALLGSYDFAEKEALIDSLGALTTTALWLSLFGYLVEWWCGMSIAFGSAVRVLKTLFWPIIAAGMILVATSQILYTMEDCSDDICPLSDTYTTLYWTILGEPVLTEDDTLSRDTMILLVIFSLLGIWWVLSVLVLTVSEAQSLDRCQIALEWYWEPKVAMIWTRSSKPSLADPPPCSQRYCDRLEELWHVLTVSIKGDNCKRRELHWYACCFRPGMRFFTPLVALVVIPIWLLLGAATLGILWPPQVRRWLFTTNMLSKSKSTPVEDRLTGSKLSQLKGEWHKFQETSMERNGRLQKDISEIKDILIQAMLDEEKHS